LAIVEVYPLRIKYATFNYWPAGYLGEEAMGQRSLVMSLILAFLLLAPVFIYVGQQSAATTPRRESKEMRTIELQGTPKEMGMQYGIAAGSEIRANLEIFWAAQKMNGMSKSELVNQALKHPLPSSIVEELKAMSEAAGVDYGELVAFSDFASSGNHGACTCFVARGDTTLDGNPVCFKTCDVESYCQALFIVKPSQGYAHMEVAYLGGAWSGDMEEGINEKGLATGFNWLPIVATCDDGYPTWVIERLILEECGSVQDAIDLVEALPHQIGGNIMVSDNRESAFIEVAPSIYTPDISFKIIRSGFDAHANDWLFEPFHTWVLDQSNGWAGTYFWSPSVARYDRAMELGNEYSGKMSASLLMSFTRDLTNWGCSKTAVEEAHPELVPVLKGGWPGNSICNAQTRQACVFETNMKNPTLLCTMWMALGSPCYTPFVPLHTAILYNDATRSYAEAHLTPFMSKDYFQLSGVIRDTYDWGVLVPGYVAWESDAMDMVAANELQAIGHMKKAQVSSVAMFLTEADCEMAMDAYGLQHSLI
jgi:hypothetical protein